MNGTARAGAGGRAAGGSNTDRDLGWVSVSAGGNNDSGSGATAGPVMAMEWINAMQGEPDNVVVQRDGCKELANLARVDANTYFLYRLNVRAKAFQVAQCMTSRVVA